MSKKATNFTEGSHFGRMSLAEALNKVKEAEQYFETAVCFATEMGHPGRAVAEGRICAWLRGVAGQLEREIRALDGVRTEPDPQARQAHLRAEAQQRVRRETTVAALARQKRSDHANRR